MAKGTTATIRHARLRLRTENFLFGFAGLMLLSVLYHNKVSLIRSADPAPRPVVKRV